MAVLFAQLGDIHFKTDRDVAVNRAPQIGAAIAAEVTADASAIVLAICGDAAYSGKETEFAVAERFFKAIEDVITQRCPSTRVTRIAIPGNHDCDFAGDQAARNGLLRLINETDKPADSVANIILTPLHQYFEFAERFVGAGNGITKARPFYESVTINDGDARVRLHLLNTAWMSSLHEQAGTLHFPLVEIAPPSDRVECSIAFLHHPTHWFSQPHAMRPLRNRLSELASVILVNHEHVSEATEQVPLFDRDKGATPTLYVSGGVIQEADEPDMCSFNVLLLEAAKKSVRISRHEFRTNDGNSFFERTAEHSISISANELCVGPAGAVLKASMIAFLEDPGAPVTHPNRDPRVPIRLSDIFLYPDLWELDAEHDGKDQKQIKSGRVAAEVFATEKVLITGSEKSGRSAIVKRLFHTAFDAGKVPIYLNGGDIQKDVNKLRASIRRAVQEQYANLSADEFEQLERSERVVLIDDVHQMAPAAPIRKTLLTELERQFGTVVLCGDDLIKMDEMRGADSRDSGLWEYRHLIILGFGEYLREEFVRKWLLLSGDTVLDDAVLDSEVARICSLLNVVIKKQLLPAYPLFLLVILQQSDLANASVQNGSYGKLFEGVMTAILSKSRFNNITIGDKYHYLAALSKKMYDEHKMMLPIAAAKQWHRQYWDEIELSIDFEKLTGDLASLGILTVNETEIVFKYAYFFCFYMAYYLNRTLHEEESRELIRKLCQQLHHRVSAEIVLFLAHLTGDPIVLDEMVSTCDRLFAKVTPANLESEVAPLNKLGNVVETISIPDAPDENRRELSLRKDELVAERLAATRSTHEVTPPEADNDAVKRLFDIHAAYKTIQILGQALRNVSGSASKSRKEDVIEKIVGLSGRVLGVYFEMFAADVLPQVIEDMAAAHKEAQPDLVKSDLHNEVCRHLTGLSQFVCFSMIKHTTFSVGSANLAPTIHRVLLAQNSKLTKILNLAFDLENPGRFPKEESLALFAELRGNNFTSSLVRILVAHHMYLYVVPIQIRQTICQKMDIKLLPAVMDRSRKRLT